MGQHLFGNKIKIDVLRVSRQGWQERDLPTECTSGCDVASGSCRDVVVQTQKHKPGFTCDSTLHCFIPSLDINVQTEGYVCFTAACSREQWTTLLCAAMYDRLDETTSPVRSLSDSSNTGDDSLCLSSLVVSTLAGRLHSRGTTWLKAPGQTPPPFFFLLYTWAMVEFKVFFHAVASVLLSTPSPSCSLRWWKQLLRVKWRKFKCTKGS